MAEIIKAYRQDMKPARFIGKKYGDGDRVNGSFGAKWGEWFQNKWFEIIEGQISGDPKAVCEDGDAYIGLMKGEPGVSFEYWIGMFTAEGTAVPDGFASVDFPADTLGVCWICGKEEEVFMRECECAERLGNEGFNVKPGWCFERYGCPRFTTPDEKGNVILDICFFIE